LVRTPIRAAHAVASHAGRRVDPGMPGEDNLGLGPALTVRSLLVLAEADGGDSERRLRAPGAVDAGELVIPQKETGEDDRQLPTAAVAALPAPAGMAGADHATKIDADLDEVDEQRLLLRGSQVSAEQEGRDTADPAVLEAVLRHVLDRLFEAEEAGA